jgi:DNA-binding IclR family transcriptional regulator
VGKAILAFRPVEEIRRILHASPLIRHTRNTVIDEDELLKELHKIAARGYSVDDMEHEDGVRCVGAPVRDAEGRVFAAVSVSGPEQRVSPHRDSEIARRVISTADRISSNLGYRSPGPVVSGSDRGYQDRKEVNSGERQQPTI